MNTAGFEKGLRDNLVYNLVRNNTSARNGISDGIFFKLINFGFLGQGGYLY